jgi:hypothetical protein
MDGRICDGEKEIPDINLFRPRMTRNGHTCIGDGYRDLRDFAPPTCGTLHAQNDDEERQWIRTMRTKQAPGITI